MEKYYIVGLVLVLCIALVMYTQIGSNQGKGHQTLKQSVQKAFPKYKVIEKQETIVICKIIQGTELEELVVLRIDPNQQKNIRNYGRRATITYSKKPMMNELKKDVAPYLDEHHFH